MNFFRGFRNNRITSESGKVPSRLTANGNGEIKCVILTDSFEKAKRGLMPYSSCIVRSYPFISAFGAQVNVHTVRDLERLPFVKAIVAHTTVTATAAETPTAATTESLAIAAEKNQRSERSYGAGVGVAVIDTGVAEHLDLVVPKVRIAHFEDILKGEESPYDDNGHGSAVAGLIAGNGILSCGECRGSAPAANIIALKAMNEKGEGSAFHILEAMQWVFSNREKYNIKVACMSFGTETSSAADPLVLGAEALWRSGVTVVASAGNSGPLPGSVTSPGVCPEIITVGAVGYNGDKPFVPEFSSRSAPDSPIKPELVAPGVDACCIGAAERYVRLSGTSMAAPIVAGYCADILARNPDFTPDKIKEILVTRAAKLGLSGSGYGLCALPEEFV